MLQERFTLLLQKALMYNNQKLGVPLRCMAVAATKTKPQQSEDHANVESSATQTKEELSFVMNLFRGQLETSQVFPYPSAITPDQKETMQMLITPIEKFFKEVNNPAKNDALEKIEDNSMAGLKQLGVFGSVAPVEYGGLGFTNTQLARMGEIVGAHDLGVGITLGAHQSIGYKGIVLFGTKEQKAKYLPQVVNGTKVAAFCLTEPTAGSDASSIRSKAVLSPDGKHYILNGSKIWISNGGLAEIMTVFAQTPTIDKRTGAMKDKVTAFIVERSFGGVTSGPPEKKMGIKGSNTTEVFFENVKIPMENVLGEVGNGFKVAMSILNNGRFGMAAVLSGTMKACIAKATEFATTRVQFGKRLDSYDGIRVKLARMAILEYVTESMAYMIAANMDNGSEHYHLEAALSKCFCSESAWYVCDESIQILGGMGYMRESGLERVLRDVRIFRIFEGVNDILRLFVALTGIQYAGAHLKELQKAFQNPAANLGLIFEEGVKRIGRSVGIHKSPDLTHLVHGDLATSAKLLATSIDSFGPTVEAVLRKYNKGIIEQQCILTGIANCTLDIYTSAVVLSRATRSLNNNLPTAEYEKLMAETWVFEATDRVAKTIESITKSNHLDNIDRLNTIGKSVTGAGGVVQLNPLNF